MPVNYNQPWTLPGSGVTVPKITAKAATPVPYTQQVYNNPVNATYAVQPAPVVPYNQQVYNNPVKAATPVPYTQQVYNNPVNATYAVQPAPVVPYNQQVYNNPVNAALPVQPVYGGPGGEQAFSQPSGFQSGPSAYTPAGVNAFGAPMMTAVDAWKAATATGSNFPSNVGRPGAETPRSTAGPAGEWSVPTMTQAMPQPALGAGGTQHPAGGYGGTFNQPYGGPAGEDFPLVAPELPTPPGSGGGSGYSDYGGWGGWGGGGYGGYGSAVNAILTNWRIGL